MNQKTPTVATVTAIGLLAEVEHYRKMEEHYRVMDERYRVMDERLRAMITSWRECARELRVNAEQWRPMGQAFDWHAVLAEANADTLETQATILESVLKTR